MLRERADPLVVILELVKCLFRFKEYKALINQENIQVYLDKESYKDFKLKKEYKESHFKLARTKKVLPKIKGFKVNERMLELRKVE